MIAYTTEFEGLFYGYAKVCSSKPIHAWSADAIVKMSTGGFTDELHSLVVADLCGQAMVSAVRELVAARPWVRRVVKAPLLVQHVLPTEGDATSVRPP
ncbi:hypothetical protein [Caenimonas soli]|uniref:hypothetical protein n=1 Tax=Caenimonas soli TaxID=2735555 RepID=UPI001554FE37|nr:hypothetical protein [Caenimonas soli]NPC55931.1 hypothetical protein [Caenimonas soli]